jgi:hypothetical protein
MGLMFTGMDPDLEAELRALLTEAQRPQEQPAVIHPRPAAARPKPTHSLGIRH